MIKFDNQKDKPWSIENNKKISLLTDVQFEEKLETCKSLQKRAKQNQNYTQVRSDDNLLETHVFINSNIKLLSQAKKREKMHNVLNAKVGRILDSRISSQKPHEVQSSAKNDSVK